MLKQCQDLTKMKTKIAVISDIHANADALMVELKSIKKNCWYGGINAKGSETMSTFKGSLNEKKKYFNSFSR